MTIDEAATILRALANMNSAVFLKTDREAIELGIEALKRVKDLRVSGEPDKYSILPGETE